MDIVIRYLGKIGKKWFLNRALDERNSLSNHIVSVQTMGSFKRLDKCLDEDDRWNWAAVLT